MGINFGFDWEIPFMVWVQSVFGDWFTPAAKIITMCGEEVLMIAIIGFLYWCYDKEYGKFVGINVMAAQCLNGFIKNIVVRRRPYMDHPEVVCRKPVEADADIMDINAQGYSCPSGHSANSAAVYGSMALYKKNKVLWIIAAALMLLIGFSRVVLGVHYPTDVLLGWALGLAVMALGSFLQRKVKNRQIILGGLLVLMIPGWFFCTSHDFYTSYGILLGMLAAFPVEEKFVKFEMTRNWIRIILRLAGGFAIYFGLSALLKLPFSKELLESETFPAHLIRALRYGIIIFIELAIYPMLFKAAARIGKKK